MNEHNKSLEATMKRFIRFLIEPPPDVSDIRQKWQARLLSSLLLTMILLGGASALIQLFATPDFRSTFPAIAAGLAMLMIAYASTRARRYVLAATITSLVPSLTSYAALLSNPREQAAFGFLLFGVFLSSILLNGWYALAIALLNLVSLLALPMLQPAWTYSMLGGIFGYQVILPVLMIVAAWNRDLQVRDGQKELAESELKFRSIFDHSVDAIGVSQMGTHVMVNPSYVRMFGYDSAKQLVGNPILDLIAPSQHTQILDYVRRRAAGEDLPSSYETKGLRRDGTEFDMDVHVSTYELAGELYTVPILRDISRRKQTEEALRASEARYRAIVEGTTDLICRFLPDTTLTYVNEAYCLYFGQSREQLTGTPFLALIPEGDWADVRNHVNRVLQSRQPVTYAHQVTTPGGEIRWQQWTDSTILDENGEVVELQSVGRDITEQILAERSVQESERRFREMLEGVSLAGVMLDPVGQITFINDFLLSITGWRREDALNRNWFDLFLPPEIREAIRATFGQLIANPENNLPHHENEILTAQGERRLIRWNNTILFDLNGNISGTASIGEDITEQKRAEEALRLSEKRYRIITELRSDYIFKLDIDPDRKATIGYLSENYDGITGHTLDQVKSTESWSSILHPDDLDLVMNLLHRITATGESGELECRSFAQDGRQRWVHVAARPLMDQNSGAVTEIVGSVKDITERKHAEEELRRSEERYRQLVELSPDAIAAHCEGQIVFVNPAAVHLMGATRPEELLGTSALDIVHPDYREAALARIRQSLAQGHVAMPAEEKFLRLDGSSVDVEVLATPIVYQGKPAMQVIARDITERKLAEEALARSEERFEQVTDCSGVWVWEVDAEGLYTYVSATEETILGYSVEEVVGKKHFYDFFTPDTKSALRAAVFDIFSQKASFRDLENANLHKDGRTVFLETSGIPVLDERGNLVGYRGADRDISQRKQAERALRDNRTMLKQILDTVPQSIFWKDKDSVYLGCNQVFAAAAGIAAPEDIIGKTDFDLPWPRPEAEAYRADDAYVIASQTPKRHIIEPLQQADGARLWIDTTKLPMVDSHGETYGVLGVYEDITERRKAEESLRLSEERYRTLAQNLPDSALLLFDKDLRFVLADGPEIEATGFSREMLEGKTLSEALPTDFVQLVERNMRRTLAGETFTAVLPYEDRFYRYSYVPIHDHSGEVGLAMILATNITQLKRTEDALKESQRRLSTALRATKVGVWEWDLRTNKAYWSAENYRVMGLEPGGMESRYANWANAVHPEDRPAAEAKVAEAINGNGDLNIEFRVIWPDGSIHWINDIGDLIRDDDTAQPVGMFGIQIDITERKRAEEALKENEVIFSSFLEHSPVYVFFKDRQIRSLRLSRNYEQMLGMPIQDLLGKTMDELFPSELAKSMVADDMRILHEGKRISVVEELNGRIYETTKFPVFKDGKPFILAGFTVDITERRQAEDAIKYAEQRYRALFEEAPVMYVITINQDGTPFIADCNNMFLGTLGYSRPEVVQQPLAEFYTSASRSKLLDEGGYQRALMGSFTTEERELSTKDGRVIKTLLRAIPEIDSHGNVYGTRAMFVDITERKHMEELLFEEKERAEITLHSIGDAVITTDVNALVEYLNPVAEHLTGWTREEAIGQPLETVFHIVEEVSRQRTLSPVQRCLERGQIVGLANHSILIRRDGREFSIDDSAAPIRNRNGEVIGVVLVFHDVTEERRLSQQVAHDAMHDSLTGLVNRREFEKRLERALLSTKEHDVSHILCYLDLDQFKIVNDTAGHAAGDELLRQISRLLAGLFRQRDTLARLGGDEFGLLLENCQLDQALIIANEIRTKIRSFPFIWAGRGFQVGVSIGVVPISAEKESINQLLSQADVACYSAKDLGRDRIHVYQAEDSETTQRHGELMQAARMRDAILHDQFRLFCQPIVKASGENGKILQYEVLLRMADSEDHLALPSVFIPSAERYGLMPAIDRWVIRETFLKMAQYKLDNMVVAINLSGNSLDDETLLDYVLEQSDLYSIAPQHICFEITETAAIHHLSKAQQFIQTFRGRGGQIALDDFGSGFSSFRYLRTLPVDYIKIDGSFVSDMLSNPGDELMVEAMTKIAHTLGIQIIAEHASNSETIERLCEIGVDYAQGFGTGIPVPVEEAWRGNRRS